jgi:hypothetical protein
MQPGVALTAARSEATLGRMAIRRPHPRAAVALLLLALVAAPFASEAIASLDRHGCCPEGAPVTDSPAPCQYLAALDCCAQLGVPATPAGDAARTAPAAFAVVGVTPLLPPPPVLLFAHARHAHGPPQDAQLRVTVLRL